MFDVTTQRAQHAVCSVSDLLDSFSDVHEPMPSPNAANKSAAKKSPEKKGIELGQQLARKRSQDFATKIQGWNQGGAGVVQQQDEVVVVEEKNSGGRKSGGEDVVEGTVAPTQAGGDGSGDTALEEEEEDGAHTAMPSSGASGSPNVAVSARTSREVDLERKAWVRRKSKPQVEIALEVKNAVAPKKRVVSDGHWRRDRTLKPETASPEKEKEKEKDTTPKPVTIRRSVVSVGLKVPPSVQDFVEEEPSPIRVRPLRRPHSRSRSRERGATPDYEDSGVKVYIKRTRRSKTSSDLKDPSTSQSSLTAGSSFDRAASSTDLTTPAHSPTKDTPPRPSTAPKERAARAAVDAENELRRVSRRKSRPTVPEPEAKPKAPSTPIAAAAPAVYGNRIEGWLAGTQDPFVDRSDAALTPEPLDVASKKSKRPDDSSHDRDPDDHRRSSGRRRRRSRPSLEAMDTSRSSNVDDTSPSATPTLRRSVARRATQSPVKGRPAGDGADADTVTTVSDADLRRKVSRRGPERGFPSTGHRLSTIASAETLQARRPRAPSDASEHPTVILEESVLSRASDGDEPRRHGGSLKRRSTKHSDLISVLSQPRRENSRVKSRRSVRSKAPLPDNATIGDIMSELTTEELKYHRELRTLVDGVIPVLLTYVLQKTDATGAKRLFSGTSPDGQAVTRPIVEMGVALEKLKATHKRIPMHDPDELVKWAENAANKYAEYLKAWRLGFQDVMVNLAPAEEGEGRPREVSGAFTSPDGEKVEVQYLLKRPLVRLKYLTKTFKSLNQLRPSEGAGNMAAKYHDLVQEARNRSNDEQARLEDETAASIDPSRARDPRSLAPLAGVYVDPTRSVRARDYFDLELFHSTGQQLTCKVELIIRDDAPDRGTSSDILFCEVSLAGRWLLFPPIPAGYLSARPGDKEGEVVVMVRGMLPGGEWRELMSLQTDDDGAVSDWLDMLSSNPAPPRLTRQSSFNTLRDSYKMGRGLGAKARALSSEVDVPIGERADDTAQKWDGSEVNSTVGEIPPSTSLRRAKAKRYRSTPSSPITDITEDPYEQAYARSNQIAEQERYDDDSKEATRSRYHQRPKSSYMPAAKSDWTSVSGASTPSKEYSVWLPSTDHGSDSSSAEEHDGEIEAKRPSMHRRTSSVPLSDMPTIHKLRKAQPTNPRRTSGGRREEIPPQLEPTSAPAKLQKRRQTPPEKDPAKRTQQATRPTSLGLRSSILPSFTPAFLKRHRRSSSPLKHEYEPSTASESLGESDLSDIDDMESVTSESSAGEDIVSTLGELKDFRNLGSLRPPPPAPKSANSAGSGSLRPSESASQRTYGSVPSAADVATKTVASIFSWSDRGSWDSLHPQECSIFVTPGLIEAFDIAQASAALRTPGDGDAVVSPSQRGIKPLVALELTPLVPLRRGTAVDISIRSPPIPSSLIRTGNNVMFRSRSPEDCEKLYHLINRARIDNPTYIALQNARGPAPTSNWAEVMEKRNAARTSSTSWLGLKSRKSSTYRSTGSRPVSVAATESSIGTMNTAFSALRRFSGGSNNKSIFNIAKSTLTSREGTRSSYSDSLSSGAATPIPIDPKLGTPLGITNAKIRLYIRETASKWRDMGSARLSVLLPPRQDSAGIAANPRITGMEKRILICGKSKGETLLDATLGESCFERVARTGIAMSVWEEATGPNGEAVVGPSGGVSNARSKVYMVQMKSERDAAYTFGLVGKLRY
ncbi:hypothetical protein B0A55_07334 [Friedmanniomyces simplex]|uniref:DH domain-containing protein n=1 Tax=Friedmanniomyces simplex TaxID=329884 RepID=A0A4V5NHV3_9PEZI|nr:hypothetical protein B0A55_07334 [Friedmanniomyces simplex]